MKTKIANPLMKLTQKQRDKLWGEDGPYSQAQIIIEERILDDSVSRIFIDVEAHINPFTFELIKKNREFFADDIMIQQIIDHAEFRGQSYGYFSCVFRNEYKNENVMNEAKEHLVYARSTIIKMHKFVLNKLDTDVSNKN